MRALKAALAEARARLVFETFATETVPVRLDRPIFSFTFDDAYVSSLKLGATILEEAGARGTYYLSLQEGERSRRLIGPGPDDDDLFIPAEWVRPLHDRGHQIGCHTYSHYSARTTPIGTLKWDAWISRRALSRAIGGGPIEHFAYPHGAVSIAAKRALGPHYKTMRSVRPGINHGRVDLRHLRAFGLNRDKDGRPAWEGAIEAADRLKGWLIFYTHQITTRPGPWDCTPEDLAHVIDRCRALGPILTVARAHDLLNPQPPSPNPHLPPSEAHADEEAGAPRR